MLQNHLRQKQLENDTLIFSVWIKRDRQTNQTVTSMSAGVKTPARRQETVTTEKDISQHPNATWCIHRAENIRATQKKDANVLACKKHRQLKQSRRDGETIYQSAYSVLVPSDP
jgi:hypothetical protein